ncbi:hypothetical protein Agub_g5143, partial [Astrephomene gubernaculifera]
MEDDDPPPELTALHMSLSCQICKELMEGPITTSCGHSFCSACIRSSLDFCRSQNQKTTCPSCRKDCDPKDLRPSAAIRQAVAAFPAATAAVKANTERLAAAEQEIAILREAVKANVRCAAAAAAAAHEAAPVAAPATVTGPVPGPNAQITESHYDVEPAGNDKGRDAAATTATLSVSAAHAAKDEVAQGVEEHAQEASVAHQQQQLTPAAVGVKRRRGRPPGKRSAAIISVDSNKRSRTELRANDFVDSDEDFLADDVAEAEDDGDDDEDYRPSPSVSDLRGGRNTRQRTAAAAAAAAGSTPHASGQQRSSRRTRRGAPVPSGAEAEANGIHGDGDASMEDVDGPSGEAAAGMGAGAAPVAPTRPNTAGRTGTETAATAAAAAADMGAAGSGPPAAAAGTVRREGAGAPNTEAPADGKGECPLCNARFPMSQLEAHVELCLAWTSTKVRGSSGGGAGNDSGGGQALAHAGAAAGGRGGFGGLGRAGGGGGGVAAAGGLRLRGSAGGGSGGGAPGGEERPPTDVKIPPSRVFHVVKDKVARTFLQEWGLPTHGSKQEMADRYTRYRSFLQTERDKATTLSMEALLAAFLARERQLEANRRLPPSAPSWAIRSIQAATEQINRPNRRPTPPTAPHNNNNNNHPAAPAPDSAPTAAPALAPASAPAAAAAPAVDTAAAAAPGDVAAAAPVMAPVAPAAVTAGRGEELGHLVGTAARGGGQGAEMTHGSETEGMEAEADEEPRRGAVDAAQGEQQEQAEGAAGGRGGRAGPGLAVGGATPEVITIDDSSSSGMDEEEQVDREVGGGAQRSERGLSISRGSPGTGNNENAVGSEYTDRVSGACSDGSDEGGGAAAAGSSRDGAAAAAAAEERSAPGSGAYGGRAGAPPPPQQQRHQQQEDPDPHLPEGRNAGDGGGSSPDACGDSSGGGYLGNRGGIEGRQEAAEGDAALAEEGHVSWIAARAHPNLRRLPPQPLYYHGPQQPQLPPVAVQLPPQALAALAPALAAAGPPQLAPSWLLHSSSAAVGSTPHHQHQPRQSHQQSHHERGPSGQNPGQQLQQPPP